MFEFETQLKRLKHEVLTAVARLSIEENLTKENIEKIPYEIIKGEKARYRCCVYKEREVVLERAQLALSLTPNSKYGDINPDSVSLDTDEQIIYIVEAACDRCPINEFTVTELCRGCLAHRCKEACKFGAISYINGRAYINHDLCKACGMCKSSCQYDAISEVVRPCKSVCPTGALDFNRNTMKAMIHEDNCINCGACMSACPFGAISDKSLIAPVAKKLAKKENMYAIVAPAITGQIDSNITYGQLKNAIKSLGFVDMIEASCGADAVTVHESNELIERIKSGDNYMTNSCCPGFFKYIEKMFPDEKDRISSTVSPMVATGRLVKKIDSDAKVIFIGPCTAKKSEATEISLKDSVDYVLTFEELMALFEAFNIDLSKCSNEDINDGSIFGRGFGASGGLAKSVQNYIAEKGLSFDFELIKVSGPRQIKKTMTMAKLGRLEGNFIEGMMCEEGCINGAGKFLSGVKAKNTFDRKNGQSTKKSVLSNDKIKEFEDVNLER